MTDKNFHFWQHLWEVGDIPFHRDHVSPILQKHFASLELPPSSRILVPLCGKSLDMLWMSQQGHKVIGIEFSEKAVISFFDENNLDYTTKIIREKKHYYSNNIEIICSDIFELTPADIGHVDAVYDYACLVALPSKKRELYSKQIIKISNISTKMLVISVEFMGDAFKGPPYSVSPNEIKQLFANCKITLLDCSSDDSVPEHLRENGVNRMKISVYLLSNLN